MDRERKEASGPIHLSVSPSFPWAIPSFSPSCYSVKRRRRTRRKRKRRKKRKRRRRKMSRGSESINHCHPLASLLVHSCAFHPSIFHFYFPSGFTYSLPLVFPPSLPFFHHANVNNNPIHMNVYHQLYESIIKQRTMQRRQKGRIARGKKEAKNQKVMNRGQAEECFPQAGRLTVVGTDNRVRQRHALRLTD